MIKTSRRGTILFRTLATMLPCVLMATLAASAFGASKPNFLIFLADDMGYGDVSYNGCPDYQTPNIDAFASNGILCTNGYVTYPFFTNAPNGIHAQKSARVEFSTTSQSVAGHEIHGFSARQAGKARKETLIPPAGLKLVEQEAWLAMSRRQGARAGMEFTSFYPTRYNEPFVVQGEGVRVAVRPVSGTDTAVQIDDDQVIYRNAYPETDSMHFVSAGRSEEFLFLQDDCAPREFEYELSELSAGTRVELVKGEVHFSNKAGQGLKIEAPWLIEATGEQRAGAVRWELEESKSGAPHRLRLVVAKGLSYPVLIDPSWVPTGSLFTARSRHTATLLPNGKVLVAGGNNGPALSSAELYDPGLGFDPGWQPLLTMVSPSILPSGSELTASGSQFKGISEASGGNGAENSSSNYPLVQLLSLANEQTLFLPVDAITGWSDISFTSTPITVMTTSSSGFPIGYALVTVFTNGIPSQSRFVLAATSTPSPTPTPTPTATPTPTPAPPSITTQPANKTVNPGETATFSVTATGRAPLRYQWRKNGVNITGATSASYTTPPTTAADNGSLFSVVVRNSGGSVTSNNATLTVRIPPTITTQPANKTVNAGQTAKFSVTATGTTPLQYQWMKNGVNITGATKASYTTPPTTAADNGSLFAVIVSNAAGSVTSNNAILTVR